jgi:LAO/AO transport system kinase
MGLKGPTPAQLAEGVLAGNRRAIGRALTLLEGRKAEQRRAANLLLSCLRPGRTGLRVGISGVPGAGKSTFIERLGLHLLEQGQRVAVLAVDPSSLISGGSILGDKLRMPQLATHPDAFIRSSPNSGAHGGVAAHTRECSFLLQAAGYDVVLIETVGVGQSEVTAATMTDCFLVLMLPNAGDEIQGLKRGILEWADVLVVNKADQPADPVVQLAMQALSAATRLARPRFPGHTPAVLSASGLSGRGVAEVWQAVLSHLEFLRRSGQLEDLRRDQERRWFRDLWREQLELLLQENQAYQAAMENAFSPWQAGQELEAKVQEALALVVGQTPQSASN